MLPHPACRGMSPFCIISWWCKCELICNDSGNDRSQAPATYIHTIYIYTMHGMVQVGIVGLGGLGHLALQFASAMGADVYAISGTASKEKEARGFGARHFNKIDEVPDKTLDVILNTTPGCAACT